MHHLPCFLGLVWALFAALGSHAQTNGVELVSVSSTGEQANAPAYGGWMSRDGCTVLMSSQATNLIPNDTNGNLWDIFIRDVK